MRPRNILGAILAFANINIVYAGNIEFNGYMHTHGAYTDVAQYYRGYVNGEGSFNDSNMVLDLRLPLRENWSVQSRLTADGVDDFRIRAAQVFAHYQGIRFNADIGRLAFPLGWFQDDSQLHYKRDSLRLPDAFYSLQPYGPNVVHNDLTGLRLIFFQDSKLPGQLAFGHSSLNNGNIKQLFSASLMVKPIPGIAAYASWQSGMVSVDSVGGTPVNDKTKSTLAGGVRLHWGSFALVSEYAQVHFGIDALQTDSRYVVVSHNWGAWSVYLATEQWRARAGWGERSKRIGFSRQMNAFIKLKGEIKLVNPFQAPRPDGTGRGLFDEQPDKTQIGVYSIALHVKI